MSQAKNSIYEIKNGYADSRSSIIRETSFPNHTKKDPLEGIRRQSGTAWWDRVEGRGRMAAEAGGTGEEARMCGCRLDVQGKIPDEGGAA